MRQRNERLHLSSIIYRLITLSSCHLVIVSLFLLTPAVTEAHSGPPFIVVPEQAVGPYTATVWADPDVGTGTFIVEATVNGAAPPEGTTVTIYTRPADGHQNEMSTVTNRQRSGENNLFQTTVPFDAEGQWNVRVTFDGPAGQAETRFEVQATPAWSGWITNMLCFLPFIALGGLWVYGVRHQRRMAQQAT
jgi:hypothetical protein